MLCFSVSNKRERTRFSHESGSIELGRQPKLGGPEHMIQDPYVSASQLLVEELPGDRIRIKNLSQKVKADLANGTPIEPCASCELDLPVRLTVGTTLIEIASEGNEEESEEWKSRWRRWGRSPGRSPSAARPSRWTRRPRPRPRGGRRGWWWARARSISPRRGRKSGWSPRWPGWTRLRRPSNWRAGSRGSWPCNEPPPRRTPSSRRRPAPWSS